MKLALRVEKALPWVLKNAAVPAFESAARVEPGGRGGKGVSPTMHVPGREAMRPTRHPVGARNASFSCGRGVAVVPGGEARRPPRDNGARCTRHAECAQKYPFAIDHGDDR